MWLAAPYHRTWDERYGDITVGMNETTVVAIIGVEAGDYSTGQEWLADSGLNWPPGGSSKAWWFDEVCIRVWFDGDGTVSEARIAHNIIFEPESFIATLRRRLRL